MTLKSIDNISKYGTINKDDTKLTKPKIAMIRNERSINMYYIYYI